MEVLGQIWENSSSQRSDALLLTTVIRWEGNERFQCIITRAQGGLAARRCQGSVILGAGPTSPELDTKSGALQPEPTTSASLS